MADGNLFTQVNDNPKPAKQFPLPNHCTCYNISKKSHTAHCWSPRVLSLNISPDTPHAVCILLPRGRPEMKEVRYLWNRVTVTQIIHPHEDYSPTGIRNLITMHMVLWRIESRLGVVFCFAILKGEDRTQKGVKNISVREGSSQVTLVSLIWWHLQNPPAAGWAEPYLGSSQHLYFSFIPPEKCLPSDAIL